MFVARRRELLRGLIRSIRPIRWLVSEIYGRVDRWRVFHRERRMSGWLDNTLGRSSLFRVFAQTIGVTLGPGIYADDGVNIQRFIRGREIDALLRRAGLRVERNVNFYYSWELAARYGYADFSPEKYDQNKPIIYDYFVVARKK
jgi:hypothetical protein